MTINKNTWLVTGGLGFIGQHLLQRLLQEAPVAGIRIMDNLSVGSKGLSPITVKLDELRSQDIVRAPQGMELVVADIRDLEACRSCATGIDTIVHLAANSEVTVSMEHPLQDCASNVTGTLNMLEAARSAGVRRFVFASSAAVLGDAPPPLTEQVVPAPLSPYGASKLAGEAYCSAYGRSFGLGTVSLRFGNVYGPSMLQKDAVIMKFIRRAMQGLPLEVHGDGCQTRDFVHVEDLCNAIVHGARHASSAQVFHISSATEVSVNELAGMIKDIAQRKLGRDVALSSGPQRPGDIRRSMFDISKARGELGFSPLWPLERGIEQMMEFYIDNAEAFKEVRK